MEISADSAAEIPPAAPSLQTKTRGGGWLMPIIKIMVGATFLAYAIYTDKFHFGDMKRLMTPGIFGIAVAAFTVQIFIGAQRLRLLLAPQKTVVSYWSALRLTYLGAFFDVFMITSVGGDAVKAIYVAREAPKGHKTASVSVLVLDRLMGLLGLLTLTLLVSLSQINLLWVNPQIRPYMLVLTGVSTVLLVGTILLLSETFYNWSLVQAIVNLMPLKVKNTLDLVFKAFQVFKGHLDLLFWVWLLSLFTHTFGVLSGYVLASGLDSNMSLGPFFVAWLISNFIVSFLPFGGIGSGQVAFDELFKQIAGIAQGGGLATAMQVTILISKSPGLGAWLISREQYTPHEAPPASAPISGQLK